MTDERDVTPEEAAIDKEIREAIEGALTEVDERQTRANEELILRVGERLAKLEAAVRVYDTLGVELVASLKALKARVDALEEWQRVLDAGGPS